jgi:hypothetical protein
MKTFNRDGTYAYVSRRRVVRATLQITHFYQCRRTSPRYSLFCILLLRVKSATLNNYSTITFTKQRKKCATTSHVIPRKFLLQIFSTCSSWSSKRLYFFQYLIVQLNPHSETCIYFPSTHHASYGRWNTDTTCNVGISVNTRISTMVQRHVTSANTLCRK